MPRYITERAAEELYDDMLDEVYPDLQIAGMNYCTSRALKEIDPTAYWCGYTDFLDAEDLTNDEEEADEE